MFEGTYTALVTPFRNGRIDYETLGTLIDEQVAAGITGVVPCGSTGESATLSTEEHDELIAFTVKKVAKRVLVIAGTGSNSTAETIHLTSHAERVGADGALLIAPYYNRPNQEGLLAHFTAVADAVRLPLLLYNIPGRTGVNIDPQTMGQLSRITNIVGVKEASGSMDQVSKVVAACGPEFTVLSGDDSLTLPILSLGGKGVIAVVSNLVPKRLCALVDAWRQGEAHAATRLHYELLPLMQAMGIDINPLGVKAAMASLGWMSTELRLPLTQLSAPKREQVEAVLKLYPELIKKSG